MKYTLSKTTDSNHIIIPVTDGKVSHSLVKKLTGIQRKITLDSKPGSFKILEGDLDQKTIYLLSVGRKEDQHQVWVSFRDLALENKRSWEKTVAIISERDDDYLLKEAVYGIGMASYQIGQYKTSAKENTGIYDPEFCIQIRHAGNKQLDHEISQALATANTQQRVMALVDAPANIKTPEYLARWAVDSAKEYDYQAEIFYKHDLENEGLHALLAVGQGSQHPPVMIKLEYYPPGKKNSRPHLGLVGKGVTFDTGGLSIKPSANMHYMKSDMGGAAAVLGAMELVARMQLDIHLVALIPCAENSVDALSVKPGDVIQSYSKKTIEVIDTDAEGRLILADAIAYMKQNYFPERMIDLATLTGSSVRALGYAAGALFSNNDAMSEDLESAGQSVRERLWPLPLWKDYEEDIQSDIADVKNLSGKPVAGAISAAKFLEFFVDDHPQWAHLDIAGVAFGNTPYGKMKSATGFGVRLLQEYCKQIIRS